MQTFGKIPKTTVSIDVSTTDWKRPGENGVPMPTSSIACFNTSQEHWSTKEKLIS